MSTVSVRSLITDSYLETTRLSLEQLLPPELGTFGLSRLLQILDNWNAQRDAVYAEDFLTFTFIANQQDYTIGPDAADFTVTSRPVTIDGMNVILDNVTPSVTQTINLRDYQWWLNLTVRAVTTTFPTDCYYEPNWPNGELHFWPKPTTAYGLEIAVRKVLDTSLTLNSNLIMPPGYQNALMLTLAEDMCTALGVQPGIVQVTSQKAREARARIFSNNDFNPRLQTQDEGMPSNSRNRCTFNYRSGLDMNANH